MSEVSTSTPVAAAPKISAGDAAIAASKKAGASNKTLLKALWSTRGPIRVTVPGFEFPVAIVKADMTKMLQALPADDVAGFLLTPDGDGALLAAAPAAPKKSK
jgi:hypothetical protein